MVPDPPDITAQTGKGCDIRSGTATFSNLYQKYSKESFLVAILRDGNVSFFSLNWFLVHSLHDLYRNYIT